jgi:hypothetical protein
MGRSATKIGFVDPGHGAEDAVPRQALIDGVGDLAGRLRRAGNEVVVAELAPSWWMLPASASVERALSLVDTFDNCNAVLDHTGTWTALLHRTACPFPVLTGVRAAASPSGGPSDGRSSTRLPARDRPGAVRGRPRCRRLRRRRTLSA